MDPDFHRHRHDLRPLREASVKRALLQLDPAPRCGSTAARTRSKVSGGSRSRARRWPQPSAKKATKWRHDSPRSTAGRSASARPRAPQACRPRWCATTNRSACAGRGGAHRQRLPPVPRGRRARCASSAARKLGFSMTEIAELVSLWHDRGRASVDVKRIAQRHLAELEQRIVAPWDMRRTLDDLLCHCHGDAARLPDPGQAGRRRHTRLSHRRASLRATQTDIRGPKRPTCAAHCLPTGRRGMSPGSAAPPPPGPALKGTVA